jgi:hypothetical protein
MYEQPSYASEPTRQVPGYVLAPAIALIAVGVLNLMFALNGFYRNVTGANDNDPRPDSFERAPPAVQDIYVALEPHKKTINIGFSVLSLLSNVLMIAGGVQMARLRMYPLAMTGSVLAGIPCIGFLGCCGIGEGVAIWSIVVLMMADVRSRFG